MKKVIIIILFATILILASFYFFFLRKNIENIIIRESSSSVIFEMDSMKSDSSIFPYQEENHMSKRKALFYEETSAKEDLFNYYIITGSFGKKINAEKFQQQLKEKGYNSNIIRSDFDHYKVSIFSSTDKAYALDSLESLRNLEPFSSAWLMKRKQVD